MILLVDRGIQGSESGAPGCELPKGIDDVRFRGIFILKVKRSYSAYMVREFKDRAKAVECVLITVRFIRDQRVGIDLSGGCMQRNRIVMNTERLMAQKHHLGVITLPYQA